MFIFEPNKIKAFITLILLFISVNSAVVWAEIPLAPERQDTTSGMQMSGSIEGEGINFKIKDSEYLNITLESSEPLKVNLSSIPEMIILNIESVSGAASAQITLGGFLPAATYYKYEDDYHNGISFSTDNTGKYTYRQDLLKPHVIFIQPRASTIFLSQSGFSNPDVGTWDPATRTATLIKDVSETIQIDTGNVILDGNGHILTGTNTGSGIYIPSGRNNVTVKNLKIRQFATGIYLSSSNGNILADNILTANSYGFMLTGSYSNTLKNNTITDNKYGLSLYASSNNTLTNNVISGSVYNFNLGGYFDSHFANNIDTTNTVDNKPIYYLRNVSNQVYDVSSNAGVIYCISCDNITIRNLALNNNGYGIFFWKTHNSRIENITAENNSIAGISLSYSEHNTLINSISSNNRTGIYFYYSRSNVLTNNTISGNSYYGFSFVSSDSNTLTGNAISNNYYGLHITISGSNKLIKNAISGSTGYNFSLYGTSDAHFENDINTTNTVDGKPIYYIRNASNQIYDASTNAGIIYCVSCSYVTIRDLAFSNNRYGVFFWKTHNSRIENISVTNKTNFSLWDNEGEGISLFYSGDNTIINNTVSNNELGIALSNERNNLLLRNKFVNNRYGIKFSYSEVNSLNNNIVSDNTYGIYLSSSSSNTAAHNTVSNNAIGVYIASYSGNNTLTNNELNFNGQGILIVRSNDNKIYHNNFLQNAEQAKVSFGSNNIFNLDKPKGGNHWSGWVTPDSDKDGFVDQPYIFQGGADNIPWVNKDGWLASYWFEENAMITSFDLSESSSSQSNVTNTFLSQNAAANNLTVTGDLSGTFNFSQFEFVSVENGAFLGQGFSRGAFEGVLDGISYKGNWEGMSYLVPAEKKIYLKGEVAGEINGILEGYLVESVSGSGSYDKYQATWKINRLGQDITVASINVEGILSYQGSHSFVSTASFYQANMKGSAYGYYSGPLDMVITQLILDGENEYKGKGFSIISYESAFGAGQVYNYTMRSAPQKVESSGLSESPLLGKLIAALDESKSPKTFSGIIERVDFGSAPAADLKVKVWAPHRISPGQKVDYIIEYRNDGLKAAGNVFVSCALNTFTKYLSASAGVYYSPFAHRLSWKIGNLPAKRTGYLTFQVEVIWGLPERFPLEQNAYITNIGE